MGANNVTGNSAPRDVPWALIGGVWSIATGSFSMAANGVLIPNAPNSWGSYNLNDDGPYDGPFEMRWNYSALAVGGSSIGIGVGFVPVAEHILDYPISGVTDGYEVHDNPAGSSIQIRLGPGYGLIATLSQPSLTDVLMLRRQADGVVTFLINDVIEATFPGVSTGAIAAGVQGNTVGSNVENFESRPFSAV